MEDDWEVKDTRKESSQEPSVVFQGKDVKKPELEPWCWESTDEDRCESP